ncbi:hypothetical protein MRX96_045221 [Rhipicephalus microplus]
MRLGQRVYPITTYFAARDNSCKGIVPGLVPGTPSSTLVDELLTPGTQILQARMMGQTNVALVTFERIESASLCAILRRRNPLLPLSPSPTGLQDMSPARSLG